MIVNLKQIKWVRKIKLCYLKKKKLKININTFNYSIFSNIRLFDFNNINFYFFNKNYFFFNKNYFFLLMINRLFQKNGLFIKISLQITNVFTKISKTFFYKSFLIFSNFYFTDYQKFDSLNKNLNYNFYCNFFDEKNFLFFNSFYAVSNKISNNSQAELNSQNFFFHKNINLSVFFKSTFFKNSSYLNEFQLEETEEDDILNMKLINFFFFSIYLKNFYFLYFFFNKSYVKHFTGFYKKYSKFRGGKLAKFKTNKFLKFCCENNNTVTSIFFSRFFVIFFLTFFYKLTFNFFYFFSSFCSVNFFCFFIFKALYVSFKEYSAKISKIAYKASINRLKYKLGYKILNPERRTKTSIRFLYSCMKFSSAKTFENKFFEILFSILFEQEFS